MLIYIWDTDNENVAISKDLASGLELLLVAIASVLVAHKKINMYVLLLFLLLRILHSSRFSSYITNYCKQYIKKVFVSGCRPIPSKIGSFFDVAGYVFKKGCNFLLNDIIWSNILFWIKKKKLGRRWSRDLT